MVRQKENAVLFTMEGFAAGILMLITIYLVLGTTGVYTSGDSHISDMQFEQIGHDILRVMDTPKNLTPSWVPGQSDLQKAVANQDLNFNASFGKYLYTTRSVVDSTVVSENSIQISADLIRPGYSPVLLSGTEGIGADNRVSYLVYNPAIQKEELLEVYLWHV